MRRYIYSTVFCFLKTVLEDVGPCSSNPCSRVSCLGNAWSAALGFCPNLLCFSVDKVTGGAFS